MSLESAGSPTPEQPLVRFGDIAMSEHWLVTPQGTVPLGGTQVYVADLTRTERVTPTWAIVLAIVGFFFVFLFSLLFLLARDNRVSGFFQITVVNGAFTYQTAEPVGYDPAGQLYELQNRANYARGLIARAG